MDNIIIYNFASDSGIYIGKTEIPPRPEGVGLPANCTTVAPPDTQEGYEAVWSGEAWGEQKVQTDEPPPQEPTVVTLAATIASKAAAVQTEKCRIRDAGFDVEGTHFDSDQAARMSYMEYAMEIAANPTYSKDWKASEGVWVTMDATFFAKVKAVGEAVFTAAFNWQKARDAELAAIKAAVAAGTMTEEAAKTAVAAVSATYTA